MARSIPQPRTVTQQIRRCQPDLDCRVSGVYVATPATIALAIKAATAERAEVDRSRANYEHRRMAAVKTLTGLIAEFSAEVVACWVRHLARGEQP